MKSASRSVVFRTEIGPAPARDRSKSGVGCDVLELVIARVGFHCFGAALRVLRVLGWWMLHICARSVSAEVAESCGTATSATTMIPLPCARTPSTHMGTRPPHTMITRKASNRNKNQPPPHKPPPSRVQHRRHPHPQPQTGTRPMLVRKWTDLGAEYDRSRRWGRQAEPSSRITCPHASRTPSCPGLSRPLHAAPCLRARPLR